MPPSSLKRWTLAAYAAPAFAQTIVHGPASAVLQGIYAKHFGLALTSIAIVLVIARIFDAVIDPVIGYCSDRYRERHGSRKPWLLGGAVISAVACWFLYAPSADSVTLSYFMLWYLLAYFGWSLIEVPYTAWGAEISGDELERPRIVTWRSMAFLLGGMAFIAIPLLPVFETTEFTPETLIVVAVLAAIVLPGTALLAARVVPDGPPNPATVPLSPRRLWRAVAGNRPLLLFALVFFLGGLGGGISQGVAFFYIDSYLKLGKQMSALLLIVVPIGIVALPVWLKLCQRYGKLRAWATGMGGAGIAIGLMALIPPGASSAVPYVILLSLMFGLAMAQGVAAPAVLADIVDYGRWRFGRDHAGVYFAFYTMINKVILGIGAALGLYLVSAFGFDPQLPEQTASGQRGLVMVYCLLPALCYLISAPLIWRFPINEHRHRILIARLSKQRPEA